MATNAVTYIQGTARTSEDLTGTDWTGGVNKGASNAPGIGVATANGLCKVSDWTVLDQDGNARDPQTSQVIGAAAANLTVTDNDTDHNDTVSYSDTTGWGTNAVA